MVGVTDLRQICIFYPLLFIINEQKANCFVFGKRIVLRPCSTAGVSLATLGLFSITFDIFVKCQSDTLLGAYFPYMFTQTHRWTCHVGMFRQDDNALKFR